MRTWWFITGFRGPRQRQSWSFWSTYRFWWIDCHLDRKSKNAFWYTAGHPLFRQLNIWPVSTGTCNWYIYIYIYVYIDTVYIYIFHHILWIGTTATFFEKARSEAASAATGAGQGLCQFTTSGAASKATKKPWGNDEWLLVIIITLWLFNVAMENQSFSIGKVS